MKKLACAILALMMLLTVLGCAEHVATTHYVEKSTYSAGEMIRIYDNQTDVQLGTLVITNLFILRDEPYTEYEYLCRLEDLDAEKKNQYNGRLEVRGQSVYVATEYAAIVQIDYRDNMLDSRNQVTETSFSITDSKNRSVDTSVEEDYQLNPTTDKSIVVGLPEKGDINMAFRFDKQQEMTCKIVCKFNAGRNAYIVHVEVDQDPVCPACGKMVDALDSYCRYCGKALTK